jgi:hypothetical protein
VPPVYASDDPSEELEIIARSEQNWQAARRRSAAWNPQSLAALNGYAQQSPWMDPDAMLGLAESGITYDSPAGQAAMAAAGADYFQGYQQGRLPGEQPPISSRKNWWGGLREMATAPRRLREAVLADENVQIALGPTPVEAILGGSGSMEDAVAAFGEGATPQTVAEYHNSVVALRQELRDRFGDEFVDERLGEYANLTRERTGAAEAPEMERPDWMSDSQWSAIGEFRGGGEFPDDAQLQAWLGTQSMGGAAPYAQEVPVEAVEAVVNGTYDPAVHGDLGSLRPDAPIGGPEAMVRAATLVLNAPIQEVTGAFRAIVRDVREEGWAEAFVNQGEAVLRGDPTGVSGRVMEEGSQSDLGIIAGQALRGEQVDTGSGFFVTPESGVGRERHRRESTFGTIDGQVITPGRWAVDTFTGLDHGDTGFGIASGLVDFAVQVGADPLNAVGSALKGARSTREAFTAAGTLGDDVIETTARTVPAVTSRYRPDVDWQHLTTGEAATAIRREGFTVDPERAVLGGQQWGPGVYVGRRGSNRMDEVGASFREFVNDAGAADLPIDARPTNPFVYEPNTRSERFVDQARSALREAGRADLIPRFDAGMAEAPANQLPSRTFGETVAEAGYDALDLGDELVIFDTAAARVRMPPPDPDTIRMEAVGLLPRAPVPNLDPTTHSGWLLAGEGRQVVEQMAREGDFYQLWKASSGKIPADVLVQIADSTDPGEVSRILFDAMGSGTARINRGFQLPQAVGASVVPRVGPFNPQRGTWIRRAFAEMPATRFDLTNHEGFLKSLDDLLINGEVSKDTTALLIRRAADAVNQIDRVDVLEDGLKAIRSELVARGIDEDAASAVTRLITGEGTSNRLFNTAANGEHVATFPSEIRYTLDGAVETYPRAHLATEMAPEVVDIPNLREIKRLTSAMQKVAPLLKKTRVIPEPVADWLSPIRVTQETGALTGATLKPGSYQNLGRVVHFADFMSQAVWKPFTLLRPAWLVRQVLIDEGLRGAATGMPSIYNRPWAVLAAMMDEATEKALIEGVDQPNGTLRGVQQFAEAQMSIGIIDPVQARRIATDMWVGIRKDSDDFIDAWGRELGQLAADPSDIAPRLARLGEDGIDEVTDALMGGDLTSWRRSIGRRSYGTESPSADQVREYVTSIWNRMRVKTGDDPTLMRAIADGYLHGSEGQALYFADPGSTKPTDGFAGLLATFKDRAPEVVKFEAQAEATNGALAEAWRTATAKAFNILAARPSNALNRNPAWRFSYFDSLVDQMPFLTREAQESVLEQARRFKLTAGFTFSIGDRDFTAGGSLLKRLEDAATRGAGDRVFADAEHVAKFEAMERVQNIYGDFSTRGQTFDALRVIVPFGPAWREAMSTYARIIRDNPLVLRRPAQAVQASMESGFFYTDESSGEVVFAYPGSGWLMEHTPIGRGAPFPLTGRVRGLTMGFEVMPGLGPVATWPLSHIIPDTPKWDGLREIVIPFGSESGREFLVPEWAERLSVAMSNAQGDGPLAGAGHALGDLMGGNSRNAIAQWQSSVNATMDYLASTGEYELSGPRGEAEMNRMYHDAQERAVSLWFMRGIAQSTAPSAPRWNEIIVGEDGSGVMVQAALDRLNTLRDEDPLHATERFLDEFGELAFGLLSPKTESDAIYTPYDRAGYDWMRDHEELIDTYPEIATLFAPTGGGDAGITAYMRRVENGEVTPADPVEASWAGQDALASALYRHYREQAEATATAQGYTSLPEELQDWLRQQREFLFDTYPGYMRDGRTQREIEQTVAQMERALGENELAATDAGQAIAEYLDLRAQALEQVPLWSEDADSLASNQVAPLREWLAAEGERLVAQHPSFANAFERVFLRELELAEGGR